MKRLASLLPLLAALALVPSALAVDNWGDEGRTDSEAELAFSAVAVEVGANPKAQARCYSSGGWDALLSSYGYRPSVFGGPLGFAVIETSVAQLAPLICDSLERFRLAAVKPAIWCEVPKTSKGRPARHVLCDDAPARFGGHCRQLKDGSICHLKSLELAESMLTLAHEAVHLSGQRDESLTQCAALQRVALVAERLGATPLYARQLSRRALASLANFPANYRLSPECRDGGALDLHPDARGWPSP